MRNSMIAGFVFHRYKKREVLERNAVFFVFLFPT